MPTKIANIGRQIGLKERNVEDLEFEEALRALHEDDEDEEFQERLKAHRKAKAQVKDKCAFHQLKEDERMRVGLFVFIGKSRNGGGFEVSGWTAIIPSSLSEVSE